MIYIIGIVGFVGGFIVGQMMLYFLLRHKSNKDLLNNDSLKWTCGLFNWAMAALGAYSFIQIYGQYFP